MPDAKPTKETFRKAGRASAEFFSFELELNEKDRKALLANPRLYFKRIGIKLFGKNNGVAISERFLAGARVTLSAKRKKKICKGVLVHLPQGPRACKVICVESRW